MNAPLQHTARQASALGLPSVGVILVNWNGGEFTADCLKTLYAGTVVPDKVLVVDNASTDGSPEKLAVDHPEILLVRNARNEGFATANNQGAKVLIAEGIEYLWILNNDTYVAPDCLELLLKAAVARSDAAALSSQIFYVDPPGRIWYAGGRRRRRDLGVAHVLDDSLNGSGEPVPVEFVSGCCMLVPATVWKRLGGFVDDYVAYSEDSEWCLRATRSGLRLYYVPASKLTHRVSASVNKNTGGKKKAPISPRAYFLMYRNHFWTVRRHAGKRLPRALFFSTCSALKACLYCLAAARWPQVASIAKGALIGLTRSPRIHTVSA